MTVSSRTSTRFSFQRRPIELPRNPRKPSLQPGQKVSRRADTRVSQVESDDSVGVAVNAGKVAGVGGEVPRGEEVGSGHVVHVDLALAVFVDDGSSQPLTAEVRRSRRLCRSRFSF
ncbi:hypothetical protein LINPERHAP1_LOCUS25027 [Linum perenne]